MSVLNTHVTPIVGHLNVWSSLSDPISRILDFYCSFFKGGIKKLFFFFRKTLKGGGGLAESEIFLSEKTEIFLEFFFFGRGGSHLFQKGVIIKNGDIGIFSPKRGLSPNP